MKNMLLLVIGIAVFAACADPAKDPLQFENIKKGSIITLRGQAFDNLSEGAYRGAVDSFSVTGDLSAETFTFDCDYLSDDLNSLREVRVYARKSQTDANRVQIGTIAGSAFQIPQDEKYPRASFSVGYPAILSALGATQADFVPDQPGAYKYMKIECDLTLNDGTEVPASSVVNSSLYESSLFYPAHNLLVIAK